MKKKFSTEFAYVLGIVLVAWGVYDRFPLRRYFVPDAAFH